MKNIIHTLEKKFEVKPMMIQNYDNLDFLISPSLNLLGITLKNDILILNCKNMFSFRSKLENILNLKKFTLWKSSIFIDKNFLEKYFFENKDNPYSIQHFFNQHSKNFYNSTTIDIEDLTQFPPLYPYKQKKEYKKNFKQLVDNAQIGDTLFSFDRKSWISKKIREIDKCQWSHCGKIDKYKRIIEATTSGITASEFSSYFDINTDLALYRHIESEVFKEKEEKFQAAVEKYLKEKGGYNWIGVIKTYLNKKWHIKISRIITPADLIYSNKFKLIAYA